MLQNMAHDSEWIIEHHHVHQHNTAHAPMGSLFLMSDGEIVLGLLQSYHKITLNLKLLTVYFASLFWKHPKLCKYTHWNCIYHALVIKCHRFVHCRLICPAFGFVEAPIFNMSEKTVNEVYFVQTHFLLFCYLSQSIHLLLVSSPHPYPSSSSVGVVHLLCRHPRLGTSVWGNGDAVLPAWTHRKGLISFNLLSIVESGIIVCLCVPWSSTALLRSSLHSTSSHTQPGGHSISSFGTAFSPFWQRHTCLDLLRWLKPKYVT